MARKKVREYDAKRLLRSAFKRLLQQDLPIHVAQANTSTDFNKLLQKHPWLGSTKLVVKPDQLFG
jgi:ATP citrate (pro-S)-lyase